MPTRAPSTLNARAMHIECPETTESPSAHLLRHVAASLERIAPERAVEVGRLTAGLHLRITESARWICQASPAWGLIQISTRTVDLAWAFAYAYWTYYKRALDGKDMAGREIDLTCDPDLQRALRLLDWALDEMEHLRGLP